MQRAGRRMGGTIISPANYRLNKASLPGGLRVAAGTAVLALSTEPDDEDILSGGGRWLRRQELRDKGGASPERIM
jgi:hypothetical protein